MAKVDVVEVGALLSDFLKRAANDKHADDQARKSVMNIIKDFAQDTKLQHVLVTYQKRGLVEHDSYRPLRDLCNSILDELQEEGWKDKLNIYLQEGNAHPIQFVCSDTLSLKYDFPSNTPGSSISGRPGILIALKNALKDHARAQAIELKDIEDCKISAIRTTPVVMFKGVLGCMDVKLSEGGAVETPNSISSQSSQASDSSQGSSEEPSGSMGNVSAESNQPKILGSSKRKSVLENDASSRMRLKTGTDQSRDGERAREGNTDLRQLGHYAAEFLSRGLYVTHNIGIMVNYNKVQVCWFDRQNVISTREFDIFKDFPLFIAFITILSRFSLSDWGIDERFYPKEDIIEATLQGGRQLHIDLKLRSLCHRVSLHGRGTMVLRGKMTAGGITQSVAVKTSSQQVTRLSERVFVSRGDQCENKTNLPMIYHDGDVGPPTSEIRQRLGLVVNEGASRRQRMIISEHLHSIDTLPAMEIFTVWYDCIHVHREMWQKGCQHGDISVNNLMYRGEPGGEVFDGVLIDWDLSTLCDDGGAPAINGAFQFTGTIPFAALDLIADDSQPRKYRHDLESFCWCLIYLCLDPAANRLLFGRWHNSHTTVDCRDGFFANMETKTPREGFESLYGFACLLMRWFMEHVTGRHGTRTSRPKVNNAPTRKSHRLPREFAFVLEKRPTWEELGEEQIWGEFCALCEEHIAIPSPD